MEHILEVQDLHTSFLTSSGEVKAVRGVSFTVDKGESVGIVGESGSGKSTIASLLMGRNTAETGSITIGNIDINEINEKSLLKNITYVGLMSVFFKGTVRENLLLADPKATDEKLWNVLSECNLEGFLKNGNGLDTLLTENAENLSGGQKQRLALARALLHDSKVYIFDEATSNVDVESEEVILKEIRRLTKSPPS